MTISWERVLIGSIISFLVAAIGVVAVFFPSLFNLETERMDALVIDVYSYRDLEKLQTFVSEQVSQDEYNQLVPEESKIFRLDAIFCDRLLYRDGPNRLDARWPGDMRSGGQWVGGLAEQEYMRDDEFVLVGPRLGDGSGALSEELDGAQDHEAPLSWTLEAKGAFASLVEGSVSEPGFTGRCQKEEHSYESVGGKRVFGYFMVAQWVWDEGHAIVNMRGISPEEVRLKNY